MGRAQLVILIVSALLAAALTGVGTYADAQPAFAREPVSGSALSGDEFLAAIPCRGDCGSGDPPRVLRHDAAPWWWAGAAAVLLVGAGAFRRADPDRRRPG